MDCRPPGSSVHGIFQARILEWVAFPFSRGSSWPRDWTWVSSIAARFCPFEPPGKPKPLRFGLNQIPYTVEMTNRFKGLDLIDRVPQKLWIDVRDIVQEVVVKTITKKKKCKKAKWLSQEALQIAEKKTSEAKDKGEKERYTHLNAEFQRIATREKKAFLSDQCKEIEENIQVRIQQRVAISFSRVSSQPKDRTHVSCIGRWILYHWVTGEAS